LEHRLNRLATVVEVTLPRATRKIDVAGSDRVDANLLRAKLAREVLRVVHQRGLRAEYGSGAGVASIATIEEI